MRRAIVLALGLALAFAGPAVAQTSPVQAAAGKPSVVEQALGAELVACVQAKVGLRAEILEPQASAAPGGDASGAASHPPRGGPPRSGPPAGTVPPPPGTPVDSARPPAAADNPSAPVGAPPAPPVVPVPMPSVPPAAGGPANAP